MYIHTGERGVCHIHDVVKRHIADHWGLIVLLVFEKATASFMLGQEVLVRRGRENNPHMSFFRNTNLTTREITQREWEREASVAIRTCVVR